MCHVNIKLFRGSKGKPQLFLTKNIRALCILAHIIYQMFSLARGWSENIQIFPS